MNTTKIKTAYNELAKDYDRLIDHKPHNAYYDRPNMLELIGNVSGKYILDAACGPGKYAEILLSKKASVVGLDISEEMIKYAKKRNENRGTFYVHDIQNPLNMLKSETFDLVICALAMHYMKNWKATLQEFYRVLKPNGELIISIEHPFFEYQYYNSEVYFDVESVQCTWTGFGFPIKMYSYRRSLQDCINPLIENGFSISKLVEPKPVEKFKNLDLKHYEELNRFPAFMCIKAKKQPPNFLTI